MRPIQFDIFGERKLVAARTPKNKKQCTICLRVKPLAAFSRDKTAHDGLWIWCKSCCAEKLKNEDKYARKVASWERNYGISEQVYWDLFEEQGGVCAICKQPETRIHKGAAMYLSVDHDHVSGHVRGLLCTACNHAIGCLLEDTRLLEQAIDYLQKHSAQP